MSSATLADFRSALADHDVTCEATGVEGAPGAIEEAVEPPAVGAPLGLDDLSLPALGVPTGPTPRQLREAATGVTRAAGGIAKLGSLVLAHDAGGTEPVSLFPPRHVAVLRASDVVPDLAAGLDRLADAFEAGRDSAVIATGPSTTGDMGGVVSGAHGPERVHVVLLTDR